MNGNKCQWHKYVLTCTLVIILLTIVNKVLSRRVYPLRITVVIYKGSNLLRPVTNLRNLVTYLNLLYKTKYLLERTRTPIPNKRSVR